MSFLSPIHDLESLDFFQSSSQETISMADKYLVQLGVMICGQEVLKLTELCLKLVKLVIQPWLGTITLDNFYQGLCKEGLVLGALMEIARRIFFKVGTEVEKSESDCLKLCFFHLDGDLFTLLSVYKKWEDKRKFRRKKWCWENNINAKSMVRCKDDIIKTSSCLLKRFRGKNNYNLHSLVATIQQTCNIYRLGIEVDHHKREIQFF